MSNLSNTDIHQNPMQVIKRDGHLERISFDKILKRIEILCTKLNLNRINVIEVTKDTINGLYDGMSTEEIDHFAAVNCAEKIRDDPQYDKLASALCVSRLHKMTSSDFMEVTDMLYNNKDKFGQENPLVTTEYYDFVKNHLGVIQNALDYNKDYDFDYFGFKTLERAYLHRQREGSSSHNNSNSTTKIQAKGKIDINREKEVKKKYGKTIERPQHLFMRVAVALNLDNIDNAIETYRGLSHRYFIFGSPTLYNSGSKWQQLSSCYLLKMGDSLEEIFDTIKDVALISKRAGGIGISISDIRASGSTIRGTNGSSSGIVPMVQVLNWVGRYVNQGGRRNGAVACFCRDTEVFTANEGVKKIQDVKIGDLVVTHKNRLKPVVQTHKNPLGDRKIYKLEVIKSKDIYVTGNHKFWSFYTKKYKSNKLSLGWNSIEELKDLMDNKGTTRQTCYVAIPSGTDIKELENDKIDVMDYKNIIVNDVIKELKILDSNKVKTISKIINTRGHESTSVSQSVNRIWNITEDFANFIGIWLGDGHIRKSKTGGKVRGIGITVHKNNKEEIAYIYKICQEIFGCNITEYTSKTRNVTIISINSHIIGLIFMELFGCYFDGKKLPNMIFSWPKKLINSLIAGLITTDGHITKKKCNAILGLSNKNLIDQIYHLCRNNGIDVSLVECKIQKGQTCNGYTVSIPLSMDIINQTYKLYDDNRIERCKKKLENNNIENATFLKILNITEVDRTDEYVYTLGVEEDHSYTVEGLIVENCYIEPWHADIFHFCELRSNKGKEEERARDIFLALWIPDLFMKRVESDGIWSLMCPDECKGLTQSYGEDFEKLYIQYENEGRYKRQIKAKQLWFHILTCQIETGMPYMLYKDHVNRQSNQKNLGVIQSSNLCVTGDTYVLTDKGQIQIKEIVNQQVNVWNGEEWSLTTIKKTGETQKLLKVRLSNGMELNCTPEHKFYVYNESGNIIMIPACQLMLDDVLIKYDLPIIEESIKTYLCQVQEICNSYGYIISNGDTLTILEITHQDKNFLLQIKLQLQTLGIDSAIACDSLYVSTINLAKLVHLGLDIKNINHQIYTNNSDINDGNDNTINAKIREINTRLEYTFVTGLEYLLDENQNTYCFTEKKRHMGMFNGILTGQCSEIVEYTSPDEIAICNLSSICLPMFIDNPKTTPVFNFEKLLYIAKIATRNLNRVIDINFYPVEKAKKSNMKHRPIGIGVQGLADVYCIFGLPYDSQEARTLNRKIFETIYYGTLEMSMELAKEHGAYETFLYNGGSPFSKGLLQYHLWDKDENYLLMNYDWKGLIENIKTYGTRNSLLTTVMPTASTSQIMGNSEYCEPITSNVYTRSTLAGEFTVINKYLLETLIELGLWNKDMQNELLYDRGSIQSIANIPVQIKLIYRTAYELKNKPIVQQAIERGPFIDQSQSLNLFCKIPDFDMLTSSHFYTWRNKLKTGLYYLRTQPAVDPIEFGLDAETIIKIEKSRKGEQVNDDIKTEDNINYKDPRLLSEIEINHGKRNSHIFCESCSS